MPGARRFPNLLSGYCFKHPLVKGPVFRTRVFRHLDDSEQRFAQNIGLEHLQLLWRNIARIDLQILQDFFISSVGAFASDWTIAIPLLDQPQYPVTAAAGSPVLVTVAGTPGYGAKAWVSITGAGGNFAANGCWPITAINPSQFTLNNSASSGAYTGGGAARLCEYYDYCAFDDDVFTWTEDQMPERYSVSLSIRQTREND